MLPVSIQLGVSNQVRLGLFVLAYNLGNFLRRLALLGKIRHWSLRSLLVKLILRKKIAKTKENSDILIQDRLKKVVCGKKMC